MSDRFVCREGHAWQLPAGENPGPPIRCPVCENDGRVDGSAPAWGTASVDLTVFGEHVRVQMPTPAGPVRPRQMLPVLHGLTDFFVERGVKAAEGKGEWVSCRKSCGARRRQLVPITPPESYHLRDLVDCLPEPRRSEVHARFARARERLHESGVLEKLRYPEHVRPEEVEPLALRYFSLQVACPFLEDESCSIYPDRPLACREYLVTSPAEQCSRPAEGQVRGVPLPAKVSQAVARLGETRRAELSPHVPLILAL